jgi:hypothetical protein
LRKRGRLVQQRTANLLSLKNLVHRNTGQRLGVRALRRTSFLDPGSGSSPRGTLGALS